MQNRTKYLLLFSLLLNLCFTGRGQEQPYKQGPPEYLIEQGGFKIFKLGDPIEKHEKHVLLIANKKSGIKKYKVLLHTDPTFATIGDSIIINDIHLDVHKGFIISISVFVNGKYEKPFLKSMQAACGASKVRLYVKLDEGSLYIKKYGRDPSGDKYYDIAYSDDYNQQNHLNINFCELYLKTGILYIDKTNT
ncbi:MAG: hypothetical protein ACQPRH_04205 [Solitalea-like symbiont of Tyrophagus putrescentiae]